MYSSAFPSGNGAAQTQQRKLFLSAGSSLNVPRAGLAWGITVTSSRVCGGEAPPAQGSHSTAPTAPAPAGEPQTFGGFALRGCLREQTSLREPRTDKIPSRWNVQHRLQQRGEIWPRTGGWVESCPALQSWGQHKTFQNASFLLKCELFFFFSKHGEFIFSADIKPRSTENKGACTM